MNQGFFNLRVCPAVKKSQFARNANYTAYILVRPADAKQQSKLWFVLNKRRTRKKVVPIRSSEPREKIRIPNESTLGGKSALGALITLANAHFAFRKVEYCYTIFMPELESISWYHSFPTVDEQPGITSQ